MLTPVLSNTSLLRRLFVMLLTGIVAVALSAAPAEAKKKKKKSDDSAASSGDSDKKKARKEFDEEDEEASAKPAAAKGAPAAPAPAPAAAAAPAAPAPAAAPEAPPPPPEDVETVISRTAGLGKLKLQHVNEMGGSFKLTKLMYELNGHVIFPEPGKPDPDLNQKTLPVWEGVLPMGDNELKVTALYKGVGSGFFAYLSDMSFKKEDTTKIKVTEGATTTVTVLGQEDSSPFTAMEDRPRFDYRTEVSATRTAVIR